MPYNRNKKRPQLKNMYKCNTFSNLPISSYESLLHEWMGKHEHKGGPMWPDWETRTFERHCRAGQPIDHMPEMSEKLIKISVNAGFWGGPIHGHFGHQIADFSMRIMPSIFTNPSAKLIFFPTENKIPSWFKSILNWFELSDDNIIYLNQPSVINKISVCEQIEQLYKPVLNEAHLTNMDNFIANKNLGLNKITKTIYVSRAGSTFNGSCLAGERYLEHCINLAGGLVFRPETHSIQDQIKIYLSASRLIFSEGSALHACQLLGRLDAEIDVLCRRDSVDWYWENILSTRVKNRHYEDLRQHTIMGLGLQGEALVHATAVILDIKKLHAYFSSRGLNISKYWDMKTYTDTAVEDIYRWVSERTCGQYNSLESDIQVINQLRNANLNMIAEFTENRLKNKLSQTTK